MLNRLFTLIFTSLILLGGILGIQVAPADAALPGMSVLFAGNAPELGVTDGQLAPCPPSPNCVVSRGGDAEHQIDAIAYRSDRETARETLLKVLGVVPRTEVLTQTEDYIRAAAESRLLGFVDDLEFYFPSDAAVIEVRSASRLGESDLGVNRRRIEQIRLALADLGVAVAP
ncbi:MAG: DUF1499 domain-containing protein [Spirulinaceae cyanobacterium]